MDDYQKKAFDLLAEVAKQMITLATAIIALTATLSKDLFGGSPASKGWFMGGALALLGSVLLGLATLACLAGGLERPQPGSERGSIYKPNVRIFLGLQMVAFLAGLGLMIWFGQESFVSETQSKKPVDVPTKTIHVYVEGGHVTFGSDRP